MPGVLVSSKMRVVGMREQRRLVGAGKEQREFQVGVGSCKTSRPHSFDIRSMQLRNLQLLRYMAGEVCHGRDWAGASLCRRYLAFSRRGN